ncbi:Hint domain-containing protein [uncultured Friedmanniella sp.]|uniref:Hint domain-containing protein n=1 Tax=uncultured Friedmanniella sp. TaxID=335381 RepID=UPI0035CB5E6A
MRGVAGHGLESGAGRLLNRTEEAVTACFVAGTPVLLADGTTKPIEDIQIGDEVAAFNPETGENEPRRVLDAFTHHDIPTYRVILDNDQAVTTTAEHPFMVDGQGWTPVRELRKGDQLVRPDGSTVTIHSIDATGEVATVHNFEVDGLHNYYIQAGHHRLLVHNANCGRADFVANSDGVVVPTSRARLEEGYRSAGLPSAPTASPGTQYTLSDGSRVRVMEPTNTAPLRASFENANGGPVSPFTGKTPQPPPGLTKPQRCEYVIERTHVELGP